jgi:hypothetical protein
MTDMGRESPPHAQCPPQAAIASFGGPPDDRRPRRRFSLCREQRRALGLLLPLHRWPYAAGASLSGTAPASPREGYSAILALRFAVDDLKAYYLEAAACDGAPSSRQLGDWLWNDTAAGAQVIALRALGLASDDDRLKAVLGNFMVPAVRVAMMGLSPG